LRLHGDADWRNFFLEETLPLGSRRTLLARHRTLFVSNKYISSTLPTLPGVPADWTRLSTALLDAPGTESFEAFQAMVEGAADWTLAPDDSGGRYVTDNELAWLTGVPPSEYR